MKRIYISGGITGIKNYKENFETAENYLLNQGFEIVNPVKVGEKLGSVSYPLYMRADLEELLHCTHIYMMDKWWMSKGAIVELIVAKVCGIVVSYADKPPHLVDVLGIIAGILNG